MRLDHLLSKEFTALLLVRSDGPEEKLPVDHWLRLSSQRLIDRRCLWQPGASAPGPLEQTRRRQPDNPLFRFEGVPPSLGESNEPSAAAACTAPRRPLASPTPLENSIASTSIFVLQATKSQRWMPWRLMPKKDVGGCDKPRGAADQASIRGCPNGETHYPSWGSTTG